MATKPSSVAVSTGGKTILLMLREISKVFWQYHRPRPENLADLIH